MSEGAGTRPPAALLLDLDGTLVDSEPIQRAAYQAYFEHRGWDVADLTPFTGRRAEDVFASEPGPWSGADPGELSAAIVAMIPADASPEPIGGARVLIESAAAAGVPVAIVTSAGPEWVELCLAGVLDVRRHVVVIVTARDVVDGKPDPAGYALACARLGVAPSDCVAVEDSPAGVAAALAAGVRTVYGVGSTHSAGHLSAAGASEVYADLRGVAARVGMDPGPG